MPATRDMRRHQRQLRQDRIAVVWEDGRGWRNETRGRLHDVSPSGMGLITTDAIPIRAAVAIRIPELHLLEHGEVRHCERVGTHFRIGVEARTGSVWRLPLAG